jgi:hypothetical protein
VTSDGGQTWTVAKTVPGEYRSGSAWIPFSGKVLAVGPTGSDISFDGGQTWTRFDTGSLDSVDCARLGLHACWASGENGRVVRFNSGS